MEPNNDQNEPKLKDYLKSLSSEGLDELLNEVLEEIRGRETEEIKSDILRHSQKIGLDRFHK